MTLTIYTNNRIALDGQQTGLGVTQDASRTRVYRVADGLTVEMPQARYALSHDAPASGVPGRADFERDLRVVLANA